MIRDEARALESSPAEDVEAKQTSRPPWGEIYQRHASLRLLISEHLPTANLAEWDRPAPSIFLLRPDLALLLENASASILALSALLSP